MSLTMPSRRSKITKSMIRLFHPRIFSYKTSAIPSYRRRFNRAIKLSAPVPRNTSVTKDRIDGVPIEWVVVPESTAKTVIYIHGGGFVLGSPRTGRGLIANIVKTSHTKALAIDYSLAPEHPYPVALDEIEKVWLKFLNNSALDPKTIAMVGDSAGATLALTSVLRLRDRKLPIPGCIVLISPVLDTSMSGTTFTTNNHKDPLLTNRTLKFLRDSYLQGAPLNDPYVSALIADLRGLPPILVHVGSEEILLGDSKQLVEKAKSYDVPTELFVGEGMWHNWHMFSHLPEAKSALGAIGDFISRNTSY